MKNRLFGSAICTWFLVVCFLAACTAPPVNNSVKVLPADPNAIYDVNAAGTPLDRSVSATSSTILTEVKPHPLDHLVNKPRAISKASALEQYRKAHPQNKHTVNFQTKGDFSIQAASTPGNCYVGPVATGTASGEIIGTVYRENDNGRYIYQGPTTYGPNLLDIGRLYYDGTTSTIGFNWRYYTGGPAASVDASVSVPGRLEVGKSYSATFNSGGISWPAGSSNFEAGTVTINVTEDKITATITAQSIYYRYQVYYYTPFFTNYGEARNVTGTAEIYTAPCAPTIDLDASPNLITEEGVSEIKVTPENSSLGWKLDITGPEGYSQSYTDSGNSTGEYSLNGSLPAGDYTLKAYYTEHPEYIALANVRIQPDINLVIEPTYINPRSPNNNDAQINVYPSNNSNYWKMVITDPKGNIYKEVTEKGTYLTNLQGTDLLDGIYGVQVAYVKFPDVMANGTVNVENRPQLDVTGSPASLVMGDGQTGKFIVDPEDTSLDWEMKIMGPNEMLPTVTGKGKQETPLPEDLKEGTYTAVAYYKDYPNDVKPATIVVAAPNIKLTKNPQGVLVPNEDTGIKEVKLSLEIIPDGVKAPWELKINGPACPDRGPYDKLESGDGSKDPAHILSGDLADGEYTAKAKLTEIEDKTAEVTVTVKSKTSWTVTNKVIDAKQGGFSVFDVKAACNKHWTIDIPGCLSESGEGNGVKTWNGKCGNNFANGKVTATLTAGDDSLNEDITVIPPPNPPTPDPGGGGGSGGGGGPNDDPSGPPGPNDPPTPGPTTPPTDPNDPPDPIDEQCAKKGNAKAQAKCQCEKTYASLGKQAAKAKCKTLLDPPKPPKPTPTPTPDGACKEDKKNGNKKCDQQSITSQTYSFVDTPNSRLSFLKGRFDGGFSTAAKKETHLKNVIFYGNSTCQVGYVEAEVDAKIYENQTLQLVIADFETGKELKTWTFPVKPGRNGLRREWNGKTNSGQKAREALYSVYVKEHPNHPLPPNILHIRLDQGQFRIVNSHVVNYSEWKSKSGNPNYFSREDGKNVRKNTVPELKKIDARLDEIDARQIGMAIRDAFPSTPGNAGFVKHEGPVEFQDCSMALLRSTIRAPLPHLGGLITNIEQIFVDPLILWKDYPNTIKSLPEVEAAIAPLPTQWKRSLLKRGTNQGNPDSAVFENGSGRVLEYYPGNSSRHGESAYWKVASGLSGNIHIGTEFVGTLFAIDILKRIQ